MTKKNEILHGSALEKLKELESESVDCIITSPPYWALRDYKTEGLVWDGDSNCEHDWNIINTKLHAGRGDAQQSGKYSTQEPIPDTPISYGFCKKCNAWKGQLGHEPTIDLFVNHLVQIFDECKRVLKKEGTCWVVIGDTFASGGGLANEQSFRRKSGINTESNPDYPSKSKLRSKFGKCLLMIPEKFAIAMIDKGWILRNKIIWHKRNCMPSSAKDRFTIDYEYIYFFTKSKKYYFKTQYEPHSRKEVGWVKSGRGNWDDGGTFPQKQFRNRDVYYSPNGRIKRCVWSINTVGLKEAHFAVFPEELVKQCIDAGCPSEICVKCKKPSQKILDKIGTKVMQWGERKSNPWKFCDKREMPQKIMKIPILEDNGKYDSCNCNAGFESGIVLDPFMGSGTTALVALKNNRNFLGIELNQAYIDIALKRIEPYLYQTKLVLRRNES